MKSKPIKSPNQSRLHRQYLHPRRHRLLQRQPAANLVSPPQAGEASGSFERLTEKLNEDYSELPIGNGAVTLEGLTRELVRPMLKEWLDQHLPMTVERLVREEIERLVMQSQRRDPW